MIAPVSLADTMSVLLITRSIYNDYRSVYLITVLTTPVSKTFWPNGKALGWYAEEPRFESASALLFSSKVVICGRCLVTLSLTVNETVKWLSSLPIS